MQIDGADTTLAADALDIKRVAVADGELLRCQWRERVGARASRVHVRRHVDYPGSDTRIMFRWI
jgi:hypothetical protein